MKAKQQIEMIKGDSFCSNLVVVDHSLGGKMADILGSK